ncbi:hypothetical protein CMO88_05080 [Candidatus Woesearchaeota archaeon]|nr:hypothetical protein [Candidatus Woesearchaeota archaeon]|tara:strand:- start:19590 stop:19958 length:369 start_codon:yes stop_codon:yes gene_type:complete
MADIETVVAEQELGVFLAGKIVGEYLFYILSMPTPDKVLGIIVQGKPQSYYPWRKNREIKFRRISDSPIVSQRRLVDVHDFRGSSIDFFEAEIDESELIPAEHIPNPTRNFRRYHSLINSSF